MKQTFGIGLFFIAFVVIVFFACYESQNSEEFDENQIQISQETKTVSVAPVSEVAKVNNDAYVTAAVEKEETYNEAAGSYITANQRYIAKEETSGYITIFYDTTARIFTQTDICKSDLPDNLQKELQQGIVFENLESVFEFLENYSS